VLTLKPFAAFEGKLLSQTDDYYFEPRRGLMRAIMRYSRQIDQTRQFFLPVSMQPLSHGSYRSTKVSGSRLDAVTDRVMDYSQSQIELAGLVFHTYNLLPIGQRIHGWLLK